jgi:hypothetical protein
VQVIEFTEALVLTRRVAQDPGLTGVVVLTILGPSSRSPSRPRPKIFEAGRLAVSRPSNDEGPGERVDDRPSGDDEALGCMGGRSYWSPGALPRSAPRNRVEQSIRGVPV